MLLEVIGAHHAPSRPVAHRGLRAAGGRWPSQPPGSQLPSALTLAANYQVSAPTVKKALGVLKNEGLVVGVAGYGTFVAEKRPPAWARLILGDSPGQLLPGWAVACGGRLQLGEAFEVPRAKPGTWWAVQGGSGRNWVPVCA